MQKIYPSVLIGILCLFAINLSAQTQKETSKDTITTTVVLTPPPPFKRAQNVFVELGGQGVLFSANYDTRFGARRNGLGGRVGIGYLAVDGVNITNIPVSLNYLLGKEKNFFEIGLGATVLAAGSTNEDILFEGNSSGVLGTMSFMYRLQPVESGFSLRVGLTPIFNSSVFLPYFAGVSLGYTF